MRGSTAFIAYTGFSVVLANDPGNLLGISPALNNPDALGRRPDDACIFSVIDDLSIPTPVDNDFADWVVTDTDHQGCEPTVPASFSSEFLSYYEVITTYFETALSAAAEITTDCGASGFTFSLSSTGDCGPGATVHFEGGASGDFSTVLEVPVVETGTVMIGEGSNSGRTHIASRRTAIVSAAVTLVAFIGVTVFL
jgi:hypothetical protein